MRIGWFPIFALFCFDSSHSMGVDDHAMGPDEDDFDFVMPDELTKTYGKISTAHVC